MPKGSKSGGSSRSALYKGMGIKLSVVSIVVGGESSSRAGFGSGLRRGAAAPDPRVTANQDPI